MEGHRVVFKHEDDVDGVPIGPVEVYTPADLVEAVEVAPGYFSRPFDPDRPPPRWVTLPQARALAAEYGAVLEES
jgi:hypothetical protein